MINLNAYQDVTTILRSKNRNPRHGSHIEKSVFLERWNSVLVYRNKVASNTNLCLCESAKPPRASEPSLQDPRGHDFPSA